MYTVFINIDDPLLPFAKHLVSSFTERLYGIPLKWEDWGETTTWGEGFVSVCVPCGVSAPRVNLRLRRKGIVTDLTLWKLGECEAEWAWWVHKSSPHAGVVWRSQFPVLLHKSCWYAASVADLICNFRSLFWGVGYMGYPYCRGGGPNSRGCSTT